MNKYLRLFTLIFTCIYFFSSTVAPVLAARAYDYDANGNMTSDGTKCYEYNEANQVKRVKHCGNNEPIADYVYDYHGNRIVKKQYQNGDLQKTVISPNDGYEVLKLASNSAKFNTTYYYANDQLISKKDPYGNRTYYHNDHLGSAAIITNQSGTLVEETSYDPWGEVKSGGTKSKFQYTGQEKDNETGLNYYNARYYDPHIRHFTQADDIIQNSYDPQTLNRYSYVRNNPLRYNDPSGHAYEILSYNNALNNYNKKPNLQNYNNYLNTIRDIQKNFYQPGKDKGGVKDSAKPVYNFLLGDDIKTIKNPNASLGQKGLAGIGIAGSVYVPAKIAKAAKFYKFGDGELAKHFGKHGAELGYKTEKEYLDGANKLFQGGEGVEGSVRTSDGAFGFFRSSTGEFGTLDPTTNRIKTYYRPDVNPANYWYNESGFFK